MILEEAWAKFKTSTLTEDVTYSAQSRSNAWRWLLAALLIGPLAIAGNLIDNGEHAGSTMVMIGSFIGLSAIFLALSLRIGNAKRRHYPAAKERYESRKEEITSNIARLRS